MGIHLGEAILSFSFLLHIEEQIQRRKKVLNDWEGEGERG